MFAAPVRRLPQLLREHHLVTPGVFLRWHRRLVARKSMFRIASGAHLLRTLRTQALTMPTRDFPRGLRSHSEANLCVLRAGGRHTGRASAGYDLEPGQGVDHPADRQPGDGPRRGLTGLPFLIRARTAHHPDGQSRVRPPSANGMWPRGVSSPSGMRAAVEGTTSRIESFGHLVAPCLRHQVRVSGFVGAACWIVWLGWGSRYQATQPSQRLGIRDNSVGLRNLLVEEKEGCRDCTWRHWCSGGCAAATFRATGRFDVRSPNCNIYKAIYPQALRLEGLRILRFAARRQHRYPASDGRG